MKLKKLYIESFLKDFLIEGQCIGLIKYRTNYNDMNVQDTIQWQFLRDTLTISSVALVQVISGFSSSVQIYIPKSY